VTSEAAKLLRLTDGRGEIREGGCADLIVVRDRGKSPAATLLNLREIEMSIVKGRIRLVSENFLKFARQGFEWLSMEDRGRRMVDAPVSDLYQEAVARVGTPLRLAGRRVLMRRNK
jgi:hypothetical protein